MRLLGDRAQCAAVLVTRDEPVVLAETVRYARALADRGIVVGAVVINAHDEDDRASGAAEFDGRTAQRGLGAAWRRVARGVVALGMDGAREWGARVGEEPRALDNAHASIVRSARGRETARSLDAPRARGIALLSPLSTLTIVGGKGGVGKTTVACALAVTAAEPSAEARVLLVSTDPAPSLADALAQPIGDDEVEVVGVPGLFARQADASAAFERLRAEYAARVDACSTSCRRTPSIRALIGESFAICSLSRRRASMSSMRCAAIADAVGEQRFARVIVDPAPTGHLLRLLEMPAIALDWTHQLMRLVLRYRELGALGNVGADLLSLAKRIRAVGALLHDPARASLIVVALDEPLVHRETRRLTDAVGALGVGVSAVIWNRIEPHGSLPQLPLPAATAAAQLVAFETEPSPRGIAAIRRWTDTWRGSSGGDR